MGNSQPIGCRILSVVEDSPAWEAQLAPFVDFLTGSPDFPDMTVEDLPNIL